MALSEEQVKQLLHINNFRELRKDQIISFVSSIPDMDKEVAINCVRQFPNFKEFAEIIVGELDGLYQQVLTQNQKNHELNIAGYCLILDDLRKLAMRDNITEADRMYFIEKSIEVADRVSEVTNRNRVFQDGVLKKAGVLVLGALTVAGSMLGVKFFKR